MNWDYLAGMVDGEGSIVIHKKTGRVVFQVSNTDINLLEKIKEFIGFGYVRVYHKNPDKWKPQGLFIVGRHRDIEYILNNIVGSLIVKQEKARKTLDHIHTKKWGREIEIDMNEVAKLRNKGKSMRVIAKKYNVGVTTIFNRLLIH